MTHREMSQHDAKFCLAWYKEKTKIYEPVLLEYQLNIRWEMVTISFACRFCVYPVHVCLKPQKDCGTTKLKFFQTFVSFDFQFSVYVSSKRIITLAAVNNKSETFSILYLLFL